MTPSSFSYNPKPSLGRANIENYPVFYCSLNPVTAIKEMKHIIDNKDYYISAWDIDITNMSAFDFTFDSSSNKDIFGNHLNNQIDTIFEKNTPKEIIEKFKYFHRKTSDLFTAKEDIYYRITSSIAHNCLYSYKNMHLTNPFLLYPSVILRGNHYNLAISKYFIDNPNKVKLVSVLKCHLKDTIKNDEIQLNYSKKAICVEGVLKWGEIKHHRFTYQKEAFLQIENNQIIKTNNIDTINVQYNNNSVNLFSLIKSNFEEIIIKDIQNISISFKDIYKRFEPIEKETYSCTYCLYLPFLGRNIVYKNQYIIRIFLKLNLLCKIVYD